MAFTAFTFGYCKIVRAFSYGAWFCIRRSGNCFSPDMVAIWADHAGLAGFAREYFEYLIKDSNGA